MLKILDSTETEIGAIAVNTYDTPLRANHNGKTGGTKDTLLYIKNEDLTLYYTNVLMSPVSSTYDDLYSQWGETGFGLKLLYGERQPTETEWDQVSSGEAISLPDIGTTVSADVANLYPVWVRTICPGNSDAQIMTTIGIKITCKTRQVGS